MKLYKLSFYLMTPSMLFAVGSTLADEVTHKEETIVTGRYVEGASSASQGKITQESLLERPMLRSGEILEAVPGLVATQHSGSGKANQYFLRGFNLDHGTDFATSVDKMPVNMRSHGHGQGYTDLNFLIPELVGSMTYKKGSYYADVGDFSGTGGAYINSADHLHENKLQFGYGKDNFNRMLAAGQLDTSAESYLIYGVELHRYDGPWEDINEDIDKTNIWLKNTWGDSTDKFSLSLMYYDNTWNSADQIPERAVRQGLISELGSIDTDAGGTSSRSSLSAHWLKEFDEARLDANIYAIQYEMDLWSDFTYFTDPDGDQFEQIDERGIYGTDISYSLNNDWSALPVTNTFGFQSRYDDVEDVGLFDTQDRVRTGVSRRDSIKESSVALYWENKIQWTEKLRSILGVRYDYFSFEVNAKDARVQSTISANSGKTDDSIVTPSFGMVYEIDEENETYFSVGEGFHSNDARGTTITLNPNTGETVEKVDPLVSTFGYELGYRFHRYGAFETSVALWSLEIDSELLFVGDEGITEDTGVSSSRSGVEATVYLHLFESTILDVEYAYTNAEFDEEVDGSKEVPGALETVISAGIHTHWNDSFYTHLRLRHFGDFPLEGDIKGSASTLVNIRMGHTFTEQLTLNFDILNLFDSNDRDIEYYYESQLASETSPVADKHYHVLEPRTFRVYLEYIY